MLTNANAEKGSTIHGDRRINRRYDLELELSYVVHTGNRITLVGSGKSVNISSGGLLFRAGSTLDAGNTVIAAMKWPLSSVAGEPLLLVVSGRVMWSARDRTALAVTRHEFIPESQYRPNDLRSILPLRIIATRSGSRRAQAKAQPGRSMILVVDSEDKQGILAKLLESYGYAVQYAERNRAAEIIASGSPEVCLLITNSMAGFERFATRLPIVLTATEGAPPVGNAELARRVIRKPFVLREIVSAIQELTRTDAAGKPNVVPMRAC